MKRAWIAAAAGALLCVAGLGAWSLESKGAGSFEESQALAAGARASARGGAAMQNQAPVLKVPASARQGAPAVFRLSESMVRAALADGTLLVELPGGIRYPVRMVGWRTPWKGRWTAIGKVATRVGMQSMVLTFGGHDVFGVLPLPDGSQLSIVTSRDVTRIAPAGNLIPPGHTGIGNSDMPVPPRRAKQGRVRMAAARRMPVADDDASGDVRIDLLGLYSDELVALRGSVETAETEVVQQVAAANQAHADSGTGVQFELKGMKEVEVAAGTLNRPVLDSITEEQLEGDLRDQLGADLVFLVRPYTEGDPSCGIAWLNGDNLGTEFDPRYGYAVINVDPCSPWVLPHELGHNMGSSHDRETATAADGSISYGAFPWSFGYRQGGEAGFATVMAYSEYDMPRIGYFSNPGSIACGAACGIDGLADNVRSLRATASSVASFRGTPGSALIADAGRVEPMQGETAEIEVPVRLSGVAPAGGLAFEVEVVGGSAEAGVDYSIPETHALQIAPGEREAYFPITIIGDDAEEGDETVFLRLHSVDGTVVEDADAVATIVDDDPRIVVEGRAMFPAGAEAPTGSFQLLFTGVDGTSDSARWVTVSPPDFAYSVPTAKSALVSMYPFSLPEPFVAAPMNLGLVDGRVEADLRVYVGMRVAFTLSLPEGGSALTGSVPVSVEEGLEGIGVIGTYGFGLQPGESASLLVMPGAIINIKATPPAPYQPYWFRAPSLQGDLEQPIVLSTLPSLVFWGGEDRREYEENVESVFGLSAPAPPGGVTIVYSSHSGTALAGKDFQAADHVEVTIPEGEKGAYGRANVIDDPLFEPTEDFVIAIDSVTGASPTVPAMQVVIQDNDARTGGRGQRQTLPP